MTKRQISNELTNTVDNKKLKHQVKCSIIKTQHDKQQKEEK